MNDDQLLRYSRQIMLPEVDIAGQERLLRARVLVVGLGGLGSPVALYLAASGVGTLVLSDFDQVDLSNLQRQIAHGQADIGQDKVASAAASVRAINPEVQVLSRAQLADQALAAEVSAADAVVDCSDNFATRFALNAACVAARTPLISGAAIRMEGQVSVYDVRNPDSPCYHCLFPDGGDDEALSCANSGVIAPLVGMIGTTQALETLKVLCNVGETLTGRLLMLDAKRLQWRSMKLRRDPACPTCGGR
ncbi:molybdopterin-synthase adenylyltransferase MoeB [Motiliproteus sediminis]|uniref:molybdopterin-synthase adenylyltransferase MoeB n=1 Tax=Motiliproteus sediminis TaxID=1468178 RepID=UPI001AEFC20D|nr:molybdopterin-synthase adenylyltransferase MoeB [Motiliproteus sediminis]